MYHDFPSTDRYELEWLQPKTLDRYYELHDAATLLGTLAWQGLLSGLVRAETARHVWDMQEHGFLNRRVEVREPETEALVATYFPKLMGDGILQLADGRELQWEPTNFWATNWSFFGPNDQPVVAFSEGVLGARWKDMFKTQFTVTVDRAVWPDDDVELLVMLGLYLIILRHDQAAAGAAAASTAAV